jgi:hypothetical protein
MAATGTDHVLDQSYLVEIETPFRNALLAQIEAVTLFCDPRIAETDISLDSKGMYITLMALKQTVKNRSLSAASVSRLCGITRRRATKCLLELLEHGYIEQSLALRRNRQGEMMERQIWTLRDVGRTGPVMDTQPAVAAGVSIEMILVYFALYAIEVGSWDSAILCDFAHYPMLVDQFGTVKLCDFAHYCIVKGLPASVKVRDFAQNNTLPEELDPSPSPLFPPSSPPSFSPLDSPDLTPSPSPYSPPSSPLVEDGFFPEKETKEKEVFISGNSGEARSARDLPAVGQIPAFAGKRPEGEALPVLVPPRQKTKRVIATEVQDTGLLAQARMDDLMEQDPQAATASVSQHPTRDLIATYIEELGFTPPIMGKTLGAAKALTKLKEPCLPEELRQIYRFYKEQTFWKDKLLSLTFLAEHLIQWRMQGRPPAKSELRKARNKEPEPSLYPPISNARYLEFRRKDLVKQHGEDSKQVKDFDRALEVERRDTAAGLYEEHGVTDDGEEY